MLPSMLSSDPINHLADAYAKIPNVIAVALGGSRAVETFDGRSDVDLYVYSDGPVPLDARFEIARARSNEAEVGNTYWEPGDEWIETEPVLAVDVMFREREWIEEQLARVIDRHEASVGYSTCIWHNVRTARILFDRKGWLEALQLKACSPYPEPLVRAIVDKNLPILQATQSSYTAQIRAAIERSDWVSVNHRIAAFLASVFDILFALNGHTHPGEKRLLEHAQRLPHRPANLEAMIGALLENAHRPSALESAEALASELALFVRSRNLAACGDDSVRRLR